MITKNLLMFGLGIFIAVAVALTGSMSFADKVDDREFYCAMVAEGTWPAYDGECN